MTKFNIKLNIIRHAFGVSDILFSVAVVRLYGVISLFMFYLIFFIENTLEFSSGHVIEKLAKEQKRNKEERLREEEERRKLEQFKNIEPERWQIKPPLAKQKEVVSE